MIKIPLQIGLKSINKGKSQGKSSATRLVMKTVSCWKRNKLSYSLAPETIKKRLSQTSLPIIFDDVKSDKLLSKITEGFDDGEVYETKEVSSSLKKLQGGCVREEKKIIFSWNMFVYQKSASYAA